jgi:hypothetical protein
VRLARSKLSNRKITVHILDDIHDSIQKYMLMLVTTNLLVALLSWIAFRWIGLENAGAWAGAAGLLHIVPDLGPGITAVTTGIAAFMQFNSFAMALLVAGTSLAIATLIGTSVATWMTGRIAHMNPAAVSFHYCFGAGYEANGECCSAFPSSLSLRCRSMWSSCIRWRSCWGSDSCGDERATMARWRMDSLAKQTDPPPATSREVTAAMAARYSGDAYLYSPSDRVRTTHLATPSPLSTALTASHL